MDNYELKGSYQAAGKTISFHKKLQADKGIIIGDKLEGRINRISLILKFDDMEYRFTKRLEADGSYMYSGKAYVGGYSLETRWRHWKK